MKVSLNSYICSWNLGDVIQTVAIERLIRSLGYNVTYRGRDTAHDFDPDDIHVVNGYLDHRWKIKPAAAYVLAGVHAGNVDALAVDRMQKGGRVSEPAGGRDPFSKELLEDWGFTSEMIGCATLTFPRYEGERANVIAVDILEPPVKANYSLTHYLPSNASWQQQLDMAKDRLWLYMTAEAVYTTRIHVALPCLAFGTPVYLERMGDERLTLLDHLGVKYNELFTMDVSEIARNFFLFLTARLHAAEAMIMARQHLSR